MRFHEMVRDYLQAVGIDMRNPMLGFDESVPGVGEALRLGVDILTTVALGSVMSKDDARDFWRAVGKLHREHGSLASGVASHAFYVLPVESRPKLTVIEIADWINAK
jgi:hypothetical protein